MSAARVPVWLVVAVLVFGVAACASSVIFIRFSRTDAVLLSAYRLLLASVLLLPLFLRAWRAAGIRWTRARTRQVAWPALFLAVHFITWILGARLTLAANASVIVNMVPVVMPLLLWLLVQERVDRRELAGTGLALAGVAWLATADYHLASELFLGDLVCFGSMLFYAVYLALARQNRDFGSVWLYVVPLYGLAGLICLAVAGLGLRMPARGLTEASPWPGAEPFMILGLTVLPTIFGHSSLNWALQHLRGQTVSIVNLSQFIFAGVMAWFFLGDRPGGSFYGASGLIVAGVGLVLLRRWPGRPARPVATEGESRRPST